jgi:hypothetical protein
MGGLAGLLGKHAEQVQRIRIVWLGGEDLPVQGLGFGEAAGLVQGGGLLEAELVGHGLKGRMFFFEKKNQKTFASYGRSRTQAPEPDSARQLQKFFGSFFQKRTSFLFSFFRNSTP